MDGVEVQRLPVLLKVSKGPIMPSLLFRTWQLARDHDIVHLHVPQLDAAPIALLAWLIKKPVVLTYHCDLRLPTSLLNWIANQLSAFASRIAVRLAHVVVANAQDYAEASAILSPSLSKVEIIPPPIDLPLATETTIERFRTKLGLLPEQKVIGMAARLASEKGVEYLIEAIPKIQQKYADVRVLYVGQYLEVMGEQAYRERLQPMIAALGDAWTFLGILEADELAAFFEVCDVTVLPSLNSTESFGMVQVESMLCGTPVVASDIPGVRQPTQLTGMGEVATASDTDELADKILRVLDKPEAYSRPREFIESHFSSSVVAERYLKIYHRLIGGVTD
jgi:glycosyltransferase involved in cell wall biosynthesis